MDTAGTNKDPHRGWADRRTQCDETEADQLLCYLCDTTASTLDGILAQAETLAEVVGIDRLPPDDASKQLIGQIVAGLRQLR